MLIQKKRTGVLPPFHPYRGARPTNEHGKPRRRWLFAMMLVALIGMTALAGCKANYTYDANGRLTSVTHNNASTDKYTYDAAGNITRIQHIPADNSQ